MEKEKAGKVIRILSNTELLINLGSNQGIQEGNLFKIYEKGEVIKDPDTNSDLGTLDYIKKQVEATTVYPNFSIVKSLKHYTETTTSGIMSAFGDKTKEVRKTDVYNLPVLDNQIVPLHIKNENIIVGDLVEKI